MTERDIARAAGVTSRAVRNWIGHADFPAKVRHGSLVGYPPLAVAVWLDDRLIRATSRDPGEQAGSTYGARFRAATGLEPQSVPRPDERPTAMLDQRLWQPLETLLRNSENSADFEAAVLALVCLRHADPWAFAQVQRIKVEAIGKALEQIGEKHRDRTGEVTAVLGRLGRSQSWRSRLHEIVRLLASVDVPAYLIVDHILDRFARYRQSSPDQYVIPAELVRLMVQLADPRPGSWVHDPCCGPGQLLVAAAEYMTGTAGSPAALAHVTGRAATSRTFDLARVNFAVRGLHLDLSEPAGDPREVAAPAGRFDVVLLNPPFARQEWLLPASQAERRWPYGRPSRHSAAFAWLQTAALALAPGGRAVVIMPASATFASAPSEQGIRQAMVERGLVRCVIELPGLMFREARTPVTVWVLAVPGQAPHEEILLIDATAATRKDGSTHRVLTDQGLHTIRKVFHGWDGGSATPPVIVDDVHVAAVPVAEVRIHGYGLQPSALLGRGREAAVQASAARRFQTLPGKLARLAAAAREADRALDQHLERIAPWIR
ncbi:class I SAM-dependent DNA methyltransferase [Dactylosporangium sp. NPDC051541]|uniref:class I SAM-dependent DNA methyltransferase n=1 Tax=Dactylosporangium sp. NPDC051541 TaxID=3363977 RepID=UPI0037ADCA5D